MDWSLVIAAYAAIVSTIVLLIQLGQFVREGDRLSVSVSTGLIVGPMEHQLGTDRVVQVKVASNGGRPIGVSSLGLRVTGGKWIPLMEHLPLAGSKTLPAVLARGEFATYWLDHKLLERELRQTGLRLTHAVAQLTDGSEHAEAVGDFWRKLGE